MRLSRLGMEYSARAQSRDGHIIRPAGRTSTIDRDRSYEYDERATRDARATTHPAERTYSSRPLANWPIRVHQAAYTYLERSICRKWKTDKVRRYLLLFALYLSNGNVYYFCLQKLKCKTWGGGGGERTRGKPII